MIPVEQVNQWLEVYKQAWKQQDPNLAAGLFTENARYAVNPLEHVLIGREAIREYWAGAAAGTQKDITFDYEVWAITNEMVIVHWTAGFTRTATSEEIAMDGVFRLAFVAASQDLQCNLLEEWWFSGVVGKSASGASSSGTKTDDEKNTLKTKISTPRFEETLSWYKNIFTMSIAEQWDEPDDKGAILMLPDHHGEALLEIYFSSNPHEFSGLSLQFRVESLEQFMASLPADIPYEGPRERPWGSTYLYLMDPNDIMVIVYEGGM